VRKYRLSVEVEAGCTAVEEAADLPDNPEREPLELEGIEQAGVVDPITVQSK
jgi:hypothetical protein